MSQADIKQSQGINKKKSGKRTVISKIDQSSSTVLGWTYLTVSLQWLSICFVGEMPTFTCLHPHFSASENLYLFSYSLNIKNNYTIWRIRNKSFSFQRIRICTHSILITVCVIFSLISAEIHTLLLHIHDLCVPDYRAWVLIILRCLNVFLIPNRKWHSKNSLLFLYKKVSEKWYYCEIITLETNKMIIFNTSECTKLLERFFLWSTVRLTLSHHCKLIETLPDFRKLNWKQMSAHTKKMILLVNVFSNDDKSETSSKRKEKLCIAEDGLENSLAEVKGAVLVIQLRTVILWIFWTIWWKYDKSTPC